AADRADWRVLVGDAPVSEALLDAYPTKLFRRRPNARQQRFMVVTGELPDVPQPDGYRPARTADVEQLTELACRLHVEDLMGPPISRSARPAVRSRMADSVSRGLTWVVERDGDVVAKLDVSLRSRRRGGQIAGVYVERAHRGCGIATAAVAALTRDLLAEGLPGVSLHVRADNLAAIRAYRRAGMTDRGPWTLALR
nr:GNAT family N-acetyltransferase [Euzebyales bacterium]